MTHHLGRASLTAASPPRGPGKTPLGDEQLPVECPTETIVLTILGRGFAVSSRRFHTPIRSLPHSRESPSIESSLIFEGQISQSCGADIHLVHLFLTGTHRCNGKMPVYRAPCISLPIHGDTSNSMTQRLSAKPPHPSFLGIAKRRTLSR